jgi:hypothetical protein
MASAAETPRLQPEINHDFIIKMITFQIFISNMKNKKYKEMINKDEEKMKTVHFGDSSYNDFIEYNKIKRCNHQLPVVAAWCKLQACT